MSKRIKGERIDWLSSEILRIVCESGGECTTRDLTRETGIKNKRINYRYDILEEAELIETHQPDFDEELGQFPPKEVTLTEEGEKAVKLYDLARDDTDSLSVDDRLSRMESRLNRLEDELAHAYERIEELEQDDDLEIEKDETWGWNDSEVEF
ncbi:winged helix-turn-helix transcriptional regulator [Natronolimnohabitans sp. A-GB9]|uniref:winged helix-turn-helix transcriptional regulator n=1 Tax=Natronolimnohabitans sp. A-GB9 TaxID=3069757 RepID=UPI0027B529AA|nr:winged helix-turn-helix transcriptional regulator [Natronolimnohabitans sp. A-GB9]MDQ2052789.1 winged helix-turn-helix transcriptional regulator [Natronolimnohabitans sp. A-GB9]